MTVHESGRTIDARLTSGDVDLPSRPPDSALIGDHPHQLAQYLLSQQIWCWGQDIESRYGNLLVRYGFQRIPAPPEISSPSCYHLESKGTRLILRGFGVFYGDDLLGGLYLGRYGFSPQLAECGKLDRPLFTTADLPPLSKLRFGEEERCQALLTNLIDWICSYELWIADEFGIEYRRQSVSRWGDSKRKIIPAAEMISTWQWVSRATWEEAKEKLVRAA